MAFQKNRFTTTAYGTVTLTVPAEKAKGARFMVALKAPTGAEIGTRPFLSFEGANKVYSEIALRLKFGRVSREHLNA